ncbi:penicillin-binding protein activator LpoB, partial [Shewanella sp. 0m-11]
MKHLKVVFILAAVIGLSACQSKVEYGDATEVETVNENFGSTDLQAIAAKMVDSMLTFPPVVAMTANDRPIIFVDKI